MIDPVAASLTALASRTPAAAALVFVAGAVTSVGPCVAPRYVALTALANGQRRPFVAIGAFVTGLLAAFVTLGFGAGVLGRIWSLSGLLYTLLAGALIGAGFVTLVRADGESAEHACASRQPRAPHSVGAVFLLGAASALVVSPCCTPLVGAIVAASTANGDPAFGALLLLCFGLGHALPLVGAGTGGAVINRFVRRGLPQQPLAIVSAILLIVLGVYYGVLA